MSAGNLRRTMLLATLLIWRTPLAEARGGCHGGFHSHHSLSRGLHRVRIFSHPGFRFTGLGRRSRNGRAVWYEPDIPNQGNPEGSDPSSRRDTRGWYNQGPLPTNITPLGGPPQP